MTHPLQTIQMRRRSGVTAASQVSPPNLPGREAPCVNSPNALGALERVVQSVCTPAHDRLHPIQVPWLRARSATAAVAGGTWARFKRLFARKRRRTYRTIPSDIWERPQWKR
jgi:hypothetical protein